MIAKQQRCLVCADPTKTPDMLSQHPSPKQYPYSTPIGLMCAECNEKTRANDRETRRRLIASGLIKPKIHVA